MEIAVKSPEILDISAIQQIEIQPEIQEIKPSDTPLVAAPDATFAPASGTSTTKVSALSLASIRAKKELEQSGKAATKEHTELPTEPFSETDMLLQWNKYAQRLSDKGQKIMEALLLINDPKLEGTVIRHQLPNEGSAIDFESGKHELLGYLRGKLHNHDITIEVMVNENISSRKAFTPQDRFNRLNEINPSLELLRKTFDLDF
ncbi:DNA polymerase III subunit gamma/tau [Flavobacterium sp.]|uniref:DNA polymerase III subunit gamma/tau n=1 Tax=Flavobacterium sp. TaxID=239 RepID=UPI002639B1F9|nr:DNA polymerase III subunit gamma/tau [Flavobacterium sp.]